MICPAVLIRFVLLLVFILSIGLIVVDVVMAIAESMYVYFLTNAVLVFRLMGVNILSKIIHIALMLAILVHYVLLNTHYKTASERMPSVLLFGTCLFTFLSAVHCVVINAGGTYQHRAKMTGAHAFIGILFIILVFWISCGTCSGNAIELATQFLYVLLFLFMILTPHFQTRTSIGNIAKYGPVFRKVTPCPEQEDE